MRIYPANAPASTPVELTVSSDEYDLLIRALAIAANRLDSRANVDTGGRNNSAHRIEAAAIRTLKAQLWRSHRSHRREASDINEIRDALQSAGAPAS